MTPKTTKQPQTPSLTPQKTKQRHAAHHDADSDATNAAEGAAAAKNAASAPDEADPHADEHAETENADAAEPEAWTAQTTTPEGRQTKPKTKTTLPTEACPPTC